MEQIIIDNGIITAHIDAPTLQDNAVEVTNFIGVIGSYANEYNSDWTYKKLSERVALGRVQPPAGYKLSDDGTEFTPKTEIEKYIDGSIEIPYGYRLTDDHTAIVAMTIDELLSAGKITKEKAHEMYISEAKAKRGHLFNQYIDKINAVWWSAMADKDKEIVSAYRQALCDITIQSGYPAKIDWPVVPAILIK